MANFTLSTNMSLPVPTVGVDPGPDYANNLNAALTLIDQHNHTPGYGQPIPTSGLNINADLSMNSFYNIIAARSYRMYSNVSTLALAGDLGCIFNLSGNLWWNNNAGTHVQLTNAGVIGPVTRSSMYSVVPSNSTVASFTTSTVGTTTVTGLSVTLSTSGRPVMITVNPSGTGGYFKAAVTTTATSNIYLHVSETTQGIDVAKVQLNQNIVLGTSTTNVTWPYVNGYTFVDPGSGAGTYTYFVAIEIVGASNTFTMVNYQIKAFEL
jgi:hypothetical protein